MSSLRCYVCERTWPTELEYLTCPVCQEDTEPDEAQPMSVGDAKLQAAYGAFGWFLHDHDLV